MTKIRKSLLTLAIVAGAAALVTAGAFSAFSSTTTNPGNSFSAGTVTIGSNDSGNAMYNVSNAAPGAVTDRCIEVSYNGSLDSAVKLYTASSLGGLAPYLNLTITPGTQSSPSFPDCTGFAPDASGSIFDGTLQTFASAHNSYANGLADNPGATSAWGSGDKVVYRFRLSVADDGAAKGLNSGNHAFTWEARNQ